MNISVLVLGELAFRVADISEVSTTRKARPWCSGDGPRNMAAERIMRVLKPQVPDVPLFGDVFVPVQPEELDRLMDVVQAYYTTQEDVQDGSCEHLLCFRGTQPMLNLDKVTDRVATQFLNARLVGALTQMPFGWFTRRYVHGLVPQPPLHIAFDGYASLSLDAFGQVRPVAGVPGDLLEAWTEHIGSHTEFVMPSDVPFAEWESWMEALFEAANRTPRAVWN